jgi:hypothetical protein
VNVLKFFIENPEFGTNSIFFTLFIIMLYLLRKDSKEHKGEYRQTLGTMFEVVNNNTKASSELTQIIKDKVK